MNKTYRRIFKTSFYRLSRSVKTRDVGKLFGCNIYGIPVDFYPSSKNPNSKRWYLNYHRKYVESANLAKEVRRYRLDDNTMSETMLEEAYEWKRREPELFRC